MVTSNHFYTYSRTVTFRDRFNCFGTRRIDQTDQANQYQCAFDIGKLQNRMLWSYRSYRKRQYPLTLRRDALGLFVPIGLIQGFRAACCTALFLAH